MPQATRIRGETDTDARAAVPTSPSAAAETAGETGRVVDLSAQFGALAGTWQLVETEPGSGSWIVRRDGVRVGVVQRESTSRGRRAWMARLKTGIPLPASGDLAVAVGCTLWRSRDLAAAGIAQHLTQQRPRRRRTGLTRVTPLEN